MTIRSPLHAVHQRLGARFTEFSGWEMPLHYEGTLSEHTAVRTRVGVFDVSHLGRFFVSGEGTHDLVSHLLCNDLDRIRPGGAQYTMMLTPEGGVRDDIILWWLEAEEMMVLPNAANHQAVVEIFTDQAPAGVSVEDVRSTTALIAVQGPDAPGLLAEVVGVAPGRFEVMRFSPPPLTMAGTGYTGEPGAELMVAAEHAEGLFDALVAAGAIPCGLGARDTLRLEMGYPLWGQDLDTATTPLEAGLGWVVGWEHQFVGREALLDQRDRGPARRLIGFVIEDRRVPRHGYALRCDGSVGEVSSGNFSPMLSRGIGMGYVGPPPSTEQRRVEVEVRGRWLPGRRVDPPFVER